MDGLISRPKRRFAVAHRTEKLVSGKQTYEVRYESKKTGKSADEVKKGSPKCATRRKFGRTIQVMRAFRVYLTPGEIREILWRRVGDTKVKVPKAMEAASATDPRAETIRQAIEKFAAGKAMKLEQELFKQKKRLADAERGLVSQDYQSSLGKSAHRGQQDRMAIP